MARARAHDGTSYGGWRMSGVVTVADTAPGSPGKPAVAPASPRTDDDLSATWTAATDADGDTITYAYQWLRDGSAVAGQSGTTTGLSVTLPKAQTTKGEEWSLSVTAQSGTPALGSATVTSDEVAVGNTAPGAPASASVSPASPKTDDDLTAAHGAATDADSDTLTYSCEWARSTDGGATWGSWGNAGTTLSKALTTKGDHWKARARAYDGTDYGAWTESAAVTIGDTAPGSPGKAALSPSGPKTDDDLTATWTAATDADGDAVTYAYQWLKDGSAAAGQSGTTTGLTVTLAKAQTSRGDNWSLSVTAQSGTPTLSSATMASDQVTVGNTAPAAPPTVSFTLATPATDDDLTVTPGSATDADGDALTYSCEWAKSVNRGTNWSEWGNPGLTLDKSLTTKGDWWKAHVRASDGSEYSDWAESAPVEVGNTAPGAPATLSLSPATPLTADDLTALPSGALDSDADVLTYECEWAKSLDGGATWGEWGHAGATLSKTLTSKGEQWKARSRAHDGTACGAWLESGPVAIGDTAAAAPGKPGLTPASPRTDDDVTATWVASSDPDGDVVSYSYQWLRNGSAVAGQSGTTSGLSTMLPRAQTTKGEKWSLVVTAQSGSPVLSSATVTSGTVAIANTTPTPPLAAVIKPGYPRTNADLKPVVKVGSDADGDRLLYRFRWSKSTDGGHSWSAWKTTRTISAALTKHGERWRMCAACYDGRAWSKFRIAAPVTILNTAPRVPRTLSVSPARPGPDDNLTATAAGSATSTTTP